MMENKLANGLVIFLNVPNDELRCSLLDNGILNKCEGCSLKYICDGIDMVVDDYVDKTTEVVNNFNFE